MIFVCIEKCKGKGNSKNDHLCQLQNEYRFYRRICSIVLKIVFDCIIFFKRVIGKLNKTGADGDPQTIIDY